jgi:hypothetical protein
MKARRFSEEQIMDLLHQAERSEQPIGARCREQDMSAQTFYPWKPLRRGPWSPRLPRRYTSAARPRSSSSIRRMCPARTGVLWGSLMICIRRLPIVRRWSMAPQVWTSTLSWPQHPTSMSSRSIATATLLGQTWTSSCASGGRDRHHRRDDHRALLPYHGPRRDVSQLPRGLSGRRDRHRRRPGLRLWRHANRRNPPRHAGDPRGIHGACDVGQRPEGAYLAT